MKFEAYSGRDLQNFLSMLNQCESSGVTDIRFVRERLQNHINKSFAERRTPERVKANRAANMKLCQSCNQGVLIGPYSVDGLKIVRCSKKCGYSEVIA